MRHYTPLPGKAHTSGAQVAEVVRLHQGVRGATLRARVLAALTRLRIPGAAARLRHYPHQLSGGTRQRVSSAIATSCVPRLLIADEPTTSLDVTIQAQYLDLLKEVQEQTGVAIILVTHDFGIVAANADRVAVMYAGRIVEMGSTLQVFDAPSHPYTQAPYVPPSVELQPQQLVEIGGQPPDLAHLPPGCPFAPRCPQRRSICTGRIRPLAVAQGQGTPLAAAEVEGEASMLLQGIGLTKYFPASTGWWVGQARGWIKAVDGVSVQVAEGETLGIVGESGSGKTTLAKLFLLLTKSTSGSLLFHDQEVSAFTKEDLTRYRRAVQAVFQDPYSSLNPRMRVADIVAEPLPPEVSASRATVRERVAQARSWWDSARKAPRSTRMNSAWTAATHCHCTRPRDLSKAHHSGRTGLGSRRLHSRANPQSPEGPARAAGASLT